MYVCMYVCMYVRTYVRTYVRMYVCMYVCTCMYMYVCMYVLYVCMCSYITQYPVSWTTQSTLHFTPWQTCSFRHQIGLASEAFGYAPITPLSVAKYSELMCRAPSITMWTTLLTSLLCEGPNHCRLPLCITRGQRL